MLSGFTIGITTNPYYGLALLCYLPFCTLVLTNLMKYIIKFVKMKFGMNAKVSGFTEEVLSSLKLIISFGREPNKLKEYDTLAANAYGVAVKSAIA